jgi:exodeoxyribonuclease VII small subunit
MVRSQESLTQPSSLVGLPFEEALRELEQIVSRLEHEKLSLEESLSLFERGQLLGDYCGGLLDRAELRVTSLATQSGEEDE